MVPVRTRSHSLGTDRSPNTDADLMTYAGLTQVQRQPFLVLAMQRAIDAFKLEHADRLRKQRRWT